MRAHITDIALIEYGTEIHVYNSPGGFHHSVFLVWLLGFKIMHHNLNLIDSFSLIFIYIVT